MKTTYRPMNNIKLLSLKKEEKILLLIIHWKKKNTKEHVSNLVPLAPKVKVLPTINGTSSFVIFS